MKACDVSTTLFLVGCLCLILISSGAGESTADSDAIVSTVPPIGDSNSTVDAFGPPTNDTLPASGENDPQSGPKSKVKNIVNKVKNKLKEGFRNGGGGYRYRHRPTRIGGGSSGNFDTSTVLWIVFGTIAGAVLIMGVYCGLKQYHSRGHKQQTNAY